MGASPAAQFVNGWRLDLNKEVVRMKCAVCDAELKALAFAGHEIDFCDYCGGLWCDEGELTPVVNELIRQGKIPEGKKAPAQKTRQHQDSDASIKSCPRCLGATESFNYAYDSNVFLNRCGECRGIWLDHGELGRVALFLQK
tara:strand:+ start:68 stop:493 length:426 start_codon:yes stop_codon:yes gene_type:complete